MIGYSTKRTRHETQLTHFGLVANVNHAVISSANKQRCQLTSDDDWPFTSPDQIAGNNDLPLLWPVGTRPNQHFLRSSPYFARHNITVPDPMRSIQSASFSCRFTFSKKYHPIDRYLAKGVTISTVGRSLGRVACTTCSAFLGGSKFPVSRYSQHQKDKTGRMTKLFQHHLLPPFFHLSITCCHTHTHTRAAMHRSHKLIR